MTYADFSENFDPNGIGQKGKIFGLPVEPENATLVLVPVPWEATVSYHSGTAQGPHAILDASLQIDLFQKRYPDTWKQGISMLPIDQDLLNESTNIRSLVTNFIDSDSVAETNNPILLCTFLSFGLDSLLSLCRFEAA